MRVRAAVLDRPHTAYRVDDIELDAPQGDEVLVRLAACGMCHSDEHLVTGDMALDEAASAAIGWPQYPIIAGHEGAGTIVDLGPDVWDLHVGDHVVTSFIPSCGVCPSCSTGHQNLCDLGATSLSGRQADGTARHHSTTGDDLSIMCGLGAFADHSVMNRASLIRIPPDVPFPSAALVACGVTTGWGSAVYVAEVQPGETVVVVGLGGVGISAVQGAAMAGARRVVGVDPVASKREQGRRFGATHTAADMADAATLVAELTEGRNADKVILAVGLADGSMVDPMMRLLAKRGRAVVTSMTNMASNDVRLNLFDLAVQQKQLVGNIFGSANPRFDIPRLLALYTDGRLKLDEMVTATYPLDQINRGYEDMRSGKNIRGVIVF